jgi:hypothetical protein
LDRASLGEATQHVRPYVPRQRGAAPAPLGVRRHPRTTVLAALAVASVASAATLFTDDFQDGNLNGWTRSGGTWSVVTDGTLALRQSSTSSTARALGGPRLDQLLGHGPGPAGNARAGEVKPQ